MNFNIFKRKEKRTVQNDAVDIEKLERIFGTEFSLKRAYSSKSAMNLSAFYGCVELISNSIAQMDINVKSVNTKERLEQI